MHAHLTPALDRATLGQGKLSNVSHEISSALIDAT